MTKPFQTTGAELETTLTLLHELFLEVQAMEPTLKSARRIQSVMVALKAQSNLDHLPTVMPRIYAKVMEALSGIRLTREALQAYSTDHLRDTQARLDEVNSTTENAAMEMLNGLDRSLAMIDQLQAAPAGGGQAEMYDALRSEVNNLYGTLQFQDIITQKLRGVASLLAEVEQRMIAVADLFEDPLTEKQAAPETGAPVDKGAFNPDASMRDVSARQAIIDQAFGNARSNGTH